MFYSHSLLSRKSQLGTVWMAAHHQSRLRKSHVIVTDISHTVEQIMFPQAPLALRLSGNLLLGVTRIYSKKVDYLHDDWNKFVSQVALMFNPVNENLLEDGNLVTFQSVTLPDTLELDAMEFDETINLSESPNDHQKTPEDITLPDHIPINEDIYISIHVSGVGTHSAPQSIQRRLCFAPTEEDVLPPFSHVVDMAINSEPGNESVIAEEPISMHHFNEASLSMIENNAIVSPIEMGRDGVHNLEPENIHASAVGNISPNKNPTDTIPNENISEDDFSSTPKHIYLSNHTIPSAMSSEIPNIGLSTDQSIPEVALPPSPVERKRKFLFEEVIVLSNVEFDEQIKDTSKLVCKRRKLPHKSLDLWKSQREFQLLQMPLLSGMCENLKETYNVSFTVTRTDHVQLDNPEVDNTQTHVQQSEEVNDGIDQGSHDVMGKTTQKSLGDQPYVHGDNDYDSPNVIGSVNEQSAEQVRLDGGFDRNLILESSSGRKEDLLPTHSNIDNSNTDFPNFPTTTPEIENNDFLEPSPYGDLPDFCNDDGLSFLLEDSTPTLPCTPTRIGKNEVCTMSARAGSVLKYLKNSQQANHSEGLCLNSILENKTRKQSARMFFETLLLKTLGIIDVQQSEDYGPITISTKHTWSEL